MEQKGSFFVQKMYERYHEQMIQYIDAQIQDFHAAQDITSEAFEHVIHHERWLETQDELHRRLYLRLTVQHYYEIYQEKYCKRKLISFRELGTRLADGKKDKHAFVDADYLHYFFQRLNKQERGILKKRYLDRKPISRIAREERITQDTVYKRLQRSREKMRRMEEIERKKTRIRLYAGNK